MAVSVKDVAQAAGVSLGTVSNVLNNRGAVDPENVRKVRSAIKKLGYVRNDAARQLRAGKSRSVGVIVQDVRNPFFAELVRGAEDAASENQLSILVADSDQNPEKEKQLLDLFEEQRVLGVLIAPMENDLKQVVELKKRGSAVVIIDVKSTDKSISSVSVDDAAGGFIAVEHLIESGRKRIAFVGGPLATKQISERLKGAKKAVSKSKTANLQVIEIDNLTVLDGRRIGEQIIAMSKTKRPDGVFAANDLVALGIMQAIVMSNSVTIPGDIALIGYDDIEFSTTAIVPLSSVRQPTKEIGVQAFNLLLDESRNESGSHPQQIVFQPILVVRESTGPKKS
jgi:LacI family transcriptional regulator